MCYGIKNEQIQIKHWLIYSHDSILYKVGDFKVMRLRNVLIYWKTTQAAALQMASSLTTVGHHRNVHHH